MATFFGEVVTGSYRYIDPDHPDYNDTRAAPQSWSLADKIPQEESLLIVTEGDIAGSYVRLLHDCQPVARIQADTGGKVEVVRGEKFTQVLCSGQETGNLGSVVMSLAADTCTVLLLGSRHVSQLKSEEDTCGVHCLVTKKWEGVTPCPTLPSPNIVSGLLASLLTEGQMTGKRVMAIITFTEVMTVDSLSLEPFKVIHKLDAVTKADLKQPSNISAELSKLKMFHCPSNLYM